MENAKKYLTIRKFSELTHTSIDTLKHYDAIGLLKPAYIGKNHYRYYLPERSEKSENSFWQSAMK